MFKKKLLTILMAMLPFFCHALYTELSGVTNLKVKHFTSKTVDSDNLWIVNFYTSASQKSMKLAPHYLKVAEELKGKINIGGLNCKDFKEFCAEFGFRDIPIIRYYSAGLKSDPATYNGEWKAEDIIAWALSHPPGDNQLPDLLQLVHASTLRDNCSKKVLCVIAFLPPLLDCQSDCRKGHFATLKEEIVEFQKQGWGWLWSEGGLQPDLERALNVGGFGYPALAVFSARKMQYIQFTGSFSSEKIRHFFKNLAVGKGRSDSVPGEDLPKIVSVSKWDGKDAEITGDFIDLADIEKDEL